MTGDDVAGAGASIIPVTDAQAEAVTALANFGTTVVSQGSLLARYAGRIFGTLPEDMVGLVLGEPIHAARTIIARELDHLVTMHQERRGFTPQPVSPSVAIPLIQAAYDESRPELQELWAALIAAAMDPARSSRVRLRFIETVKQFDPLDALLLRQVPIEFTNLEPSAAAFFAKALSADVGEVVLSMENLERLGCAKTNDRNLRYFVATALGRELLRACED